MTYYITYGEFQRELREYYLRTGNRMQFIEMANYLYQKGRLSEHPISSPPSGVYEHLDDDEFNQVVDALVLELENDFPTGLMVAESDIIPDTRDVYLLRHPRYTRPQKHSHDYFEINYVVTGTCHFTFEDTDRVLESGDLCIIAPGSKHDVIINDESTVFEILLRKSTFERTFFSLLSQKNLLSYFFRTILQGEGHANFLLFSGIDHPLFKSHLRNALAECYHWDAYSNACCINWINLIFSILLRTYDQTLQFYDYQIDADFTLVLQYIQHNYRNITLSALAKLFHYSEPYISKKIKQHTGHTLTELVKRLRMADAAHYLTHSDLKINEIAELTGYNSADHFSRIFRGTYQMSPQVYRKNNAAKVEPMHPFYTSS